MSTEETKPKIDDVETEEEKSSQDESDLDKSASVDSKEEAKPATNDVKSSDKTDDKESEEEEEEEEDKKDVKKPAKKRGAKAEGKKDKKDKKSEDEDDEEAEDEDEEEEGEDEKKNGVPEKETRERKKPERLVGGDEEKPERKEVEIIIPEGKGSAFGDCPRIEHFINNKDLDQVKKLHQICFGKIGKLSSDDLKANLFKFKGFDYEPESDAYTKKKQTIAKLDIKHLRDLLDFFDLEKKGKKEDIVTRIMEFLMDPKDSGKPLPVAPAPRPKRTSAVKANNRGYAGNDVDDSDDEDGGSKRARGRRTKARPSYKDDSSSEEDRKGKRGGAPKYSESDPESEPEFSASDSEDDSRKKKKSTPAKPKGRGAPKKKAAPTPKSSTKRTAAKRGKKKASDSEAPSESEDEPLQKKSKKFPSDDEIKKYVKTILDGANLEEITMKTVCKQVYGRFPDHDLTHKKDLIKSTVKSLIAT